MIIMLSLIGSGYMRGLECVDINILYARGIQCQGVNYGHGGWKLRGGKDKRLGPIGFLD